MQICAYTCVCIYVIDIYICIWYTYIYVWYTCMYGIYDTRKQMKHIHAIYVNAYVWYMYMHTRTAWERGRKERETETRDTHTPCPRCTHQAVQPVVDAWKKMRPWGCMRPWSAADRRGRRSTQLDSRLSETPALRCRSARSPSRNRTALPRGGGTQSSPAQRGRHRRQCRKSLRAKRTQPTNCFGESCDGFRRADRTSRAPGSAPRVWAAMSRSPPAGACHCPPPLHQVSCQAVRVRTLWMLLVLLYKKQSSIFADSLFARVWVSTLLQALPQRDPRWTSSMV